MNNEEAFLRDDPGGEEYVVHNELDAAEGNATHRRSDAPPTRKAPLLRIVASPMDTSSRDVRMGTRHSFAGERKDVIDHLLHLLGHSFDAAVSPVPSEESCDGDRVSIDLVIRSIKTSSSLPIRSGLARWQLARVEKFIESNLSDPIRLKALAQLVNLSESQFRRAFKAATGVPPHQWILMMRVERAKELLLEGESKMIDIALATGFVEQSHFNRLFARWTGQPPKIWQRTHRI